MKQTCITDAFLIQIYIQVLSWLLTGDSGGVGQRGEHGPPGPPGLEGKVGPEGEKVFNVREWTSL